MGNTNRCPHCNRFGSAELNGYCKTCYSERNITDSRAFLVKLDAFHQQSPKVVVGALKEVGAKVADEVRPEDRDVVLNICRRRLPRTRQRHVVQDDTFVGEDDYFGFRKHGEAEVNDYGLIRGDYEIEQ